MPAIYSSIRLSFISIHSLIHPSIHPSIHASISPLCPSPLFHLIHPVSFMSMHSLPSTCLLYPLLSSTTFPDLALPQTAFPCLIFTCLPRPLPLPSLTSPALPDFALPCLALPCLALPCLTLSCLALPYLAMSYCHVMWQWQCSGARGTASSSIRNTHEGNVVRRIHQGIV